MVDGHTPANDPDTTGPSGEESNAPAGDDERARQNQPSPAAGSDTVRDERPGDDDIRRRPGCVKVGCLSLLTMLVILALAGGGFAWYLNHQLDNIERRAGMLPVGGPTKQADAGDAKNILLIGTDSRDAKSLSDASRSDVIQLVHIAKGGKAMQVVHFPRDLYVAIPGHGKNKINAAYAFGGPSLLVQTIQDLTGTKIDHVAQIGFPGFAKVTNELGGVDIYVSQPYTEGSTKWDVGMHHMTGDQALAFVRERHQLREGDIDRGRNQQEWLSAVMKKLLKPSVLLNPIKVLNVTKDLTGDGNMIVDDGMTSSYIRSTAVSLRSLKKSNITFYTAPFSGFANDPKAGAIDVVDEAKMKALGNALAHDTMASYTGPKNTIH